MNSNVLNLGLMEDVEIDLDIAALELAALDNPGVDLDRYIEELSVFEADLRSVAGPATSTADRVQALSTVMAEDHGFAGDRITYDSPDNADMIAVMGRRLGLPVSLSILYVAMARRLDWAAMPLNAPGHVVDRIGDASNALIIDPFNGGRLVEAARLEALLGQTAGRAAASPDDVLPMSNRSTLVRLILNQATRAEQGGDPARALALYERMTIAAPMHPHGWWERTRLQLVAGDLPGARSSLGAMLEITRDDGLRQRVSAALDGLARPTT